MTEQARKKRILWVDDDQAMIRALKLDLELEGFEVVTARSPDEIWELLKRGAEPVSAIVLDIMMPYGESFTPAESGKGIDTGLCVLRRLRSDSQYSAPPILVFTIRSDQRLKDWCDEHSIPLLLKDSDGPGELGEALREMLAAR